MRPDCPHCRKPLAGRYLGNGWTCQACHLIFPIRWWKQVGRELFRRNQAFARTEQV